MARVFDEPLYLNRAESSIGHATKNACRCCSTAGLSLHEDANSENSECVSGASCDFRCGCGRHLGSTGRSYNDRYTSVSGWKPCLSIYSGFGGRMPVQRSRDHAVQFPCIQIVIFHRNICRRHEPEGSNNLRWLPQWWKCERYRTDVTEIAGMAFWGKAVVMVIVSGYRKLTWRTAPVFLETLGFGKAESVLPAVRRLEIQRRDV